jgi:hypothetical protein
MNTDPDVMRWVLTMETDGAVRVETNWAIHPTTVPTTRTFPNGVEGGRYLNEYKLNGDLVRIQSHEGNGLEFVVRDNELKFRDEEGESNDA